MSEHQYDIRVSEISVDPNPLMVERQGPDNFTCFQTRERCALEIAAYVFKCLNTILRLMENNHVMPSQWPIAGGPLMARRASWVEAR